MFRVKIKKQFKCDRDILWDVITNNNNYSWRNDLSKIEIIDDKKFVEYDKNNFPTYFTIIKKDKLKEYQFDLKNTNINGKWYGYFKEYANGIIEIEFIEEIEVKKIIMKLLAIPYLKHQQKKYIYDLEEEINKKESSMNV